MPIPIEKARWPEFGLDDVTLKQHILNYLRRRTSAPVPAVQRTLIQALKGKTQGLDFTIDDARTSILRTAILLSSKNHIMANELIASIKIKLPPVFTKHGQEYAQNHYGLCEFLSLLWIRAHLIMDPEGSTHPNKADFFAATTSQFMPKLSHEPTEKERKSTLSALLKRLQERNFIESANWGEIKNNITSMPIAGVYHIYSSLFAQNIEKIIEDMMRQGIKNLAVFVSSMFLNHAMAMMIKVRQNYITVIFYDPNAQHGDAKIALSIDSRDSASTIASIENLFSFSGISHYENYPDSDISLILLNTNQLESFRLTVPCRISKDLISECLLTLAAFGDNSDCIYIIRQLLQQPDIDVNAHIPAAGSEITALYLAAIKNHVKTVEFLMSDPRINPNILSAEGGSILMFATSEGNINIVKILVSHLRTDINIRLSNGYSALTLALHKKHSEIGAILLKRKDLQIISKDIEIATQTHSPLLPLLLSYPNFQK